MDVAKLVEDVTGRVRAALDEAEETAREIVATAEDKASDLIANAEDEAEKIRNRAETESQDRLTKVREALSSLEGVVSQPGESGSPSWKSGSPSWESESPSSEIDPGPAEVPEPMPPVEPEPSPPTEPEPMPPAEPEPMPPDPEIEPPAPAQPDRESPEMANGEGFSVRGSRASERSHDPTAARIVAMKMALDGSSREEITIHIDENYEVEATEKLVDDVVSRAQR
ncbi:MAG TPA: hypothetical protein VD766_02550 [Solirubrobacterales bacterium]|nr:hypothetical protein [Solirubrobacterales bacterium]